MAFFNDSAEVHKYIGGVFSASNDTPVGPKLGEADIDLQVYYSDPDTKMLIKLRDGKVDVVPDEDMEDATVKMYMPADVADKFWRGDYNLAVGLAKGQVKAKGPVNQILKLVPLTRKLFPYYREMIAEKDGTTAAA